MDSSDKTVVMDSLNSFEPDNCPVCRNTLEPETGSGFSVRCPVCGYSRKETLSLSAGSVLGGKYRILSPLNSGGCGDLFLCCPLNDLSVRYVLKVLKTSDHANRLRFEREAIVLSSVRNERIASVIEYLNTDDCSFIIMEYIKGKNLKELYSEYHFGEESSLLIIRETAIALQYIWENYFFIHRDIKPENIMLDERNHLKLLDFGLSKQVNVGETTMITMECSGLGTPGYMSPEQFTDSKHVDFRSDIFSLGATLFFLLTGEKPFSGRSMQEVFADTIRNSPPKYQRMASKCSKGCIELVRRMMQKEPRDRYGSYSELIQDINQLLQ